MVTFTLENPPIGVGDAVDSIVQAKLDDHIPRSRRAVLGAFSVVLAWIVLVFLIIILPNTSQFRVNGTIALIILAAGVAVLFLLFAAISLIAAWVQHALIHWTPWGLVLAVWLVIWEISTAKSGWLHPPFFAAPQQLLYEAFNDRGILAESIYSSMLLLLSGYSIGLLTGIISGMWIGWSHKANYWLHPLLVYIGPVPAIAWIPIVFVIAPSSYVGAVFLIALTVWSDCYFGTFLRWFVNSATQDSG